MESIKIDTPYITLGQLLKRLDVINSGGQAKYFLQEETVKVNGEVETRRGEKFIPGIKWISPGSGPWSCRTGKGGSSFCVSKPWN